MEVVEYSKILSMLAVKTKHKKTILKRLGCMVSCGVGEIGK